MKAPRFRLQFVLEHRRRLQDRAITECAAAERKLREAAGRVLEIEEQIRALAANGFSFNTFTATELAQKAAYNVRLHEELSRGCLAEKSAEQAVGRARAMLEKAKRDRELIEKLRENEQEAQTKAALATEQGFLDELSMLRGRHEWIGVL